MKGTEERPDSSVSQVARRLAQLLAGDWRQGELVAFHTAMKLELIEVADAYALGVRAALALPWSRGRDVNALQHAAGGRARRTGALALVRGHALRHQVAWLLRQVYLDSSPRPAAVGGVG